MRLVRSTREPARILIDPGGCLGAEKHSKRKYPRSQDVRCASERSYLIAGSRLIKKSELFSRADLPSPEPRTMKDEH